MKMNRRILNELIQYITTVEQINGRMMVDEFEFKTIEEVAPGEGNCIMGDSRITGLNGHIAFLPINRTRYIDDCNVSATHDTPDYISKISGIK